MKSNDLKNLLDACSHTTLFTTKIRNVELGTHQCDIEFTNDELIIYSESSTPVIYKLNSWEEDFQIIPTKFRKEGYAFSLDLDLKSYSKQYIVTLKIILYPKELEKIDKTIDIND
jgi:hypothetical protein